MTAAARTVIESAFHGACACERTDFGVVVKICAWCELIERLDALAGEADPEVVLRSLPAITSALKDIVAEVRTRAADELIKQYGGSVDLASQELGVSRAWLYRIKS